MYNPFTSIISYNHVQRKKANNDESSKKENRSVEYSSKCRRKLLKILARIQSSPGTLNVQRVFSDSFLQEIQRSSIFVFPSDVGRVTKESYGDHAHRTLFCIRPARSGLRRCPWTQTHSVFAPRGAASGGALCLKLYCTFY